MRRHADEYTVDPRRSLAGPKPFVGCPRRTRAPFAAPDREWRNGRDFEMRAGRVSVRWVCDDTLFSIKEAETHVS